MLERIIKWTSTYKDVKEENDNLIEENFTKEKKIHNLNLKNQDLKEIKNYFEGGKIVRIKNK